MSTSNAAVKALGSGLDAGKNSLLKIGLPLAAGAALVAAVAFIAGRIAK